MVFIFFSYCEPEMFVLYLSTASDAMVDKRSLCFSIIFNSFYKKKWSFEVVDVLLEC